MDVSKNIFSVSSRNCYTNYSKGSFMISFSDCSSSFSGYFNKTYYWQLLQDFLQENSLEFGFFFQKILLNFLEGFFQKFFWKLFTKSLWNFSRNGKWLQFTVYLNYSESLPGSRVSFVGWTPSKTVLWISLEIIPVILLENFLRFFSEITPEIPS